MEKRPSKQNDPENARKSFQELEDSRFLEDGYGIFLEMKKKYPNNTTADLDNILNGICASLLCLMGFHVNEDDYKNFIQLIWQILNKNTTQKIKIDIPIHSDLERKQEDSDHLNGFRCTNDLDPEQ